MIRRATWVMCAVLALAASSPGVTEEPAPATQHMERLWHFGRVVRDVEQGIAFYHDLLGLGLQGARGDARPYLHSAPINEFVDAPPEAELRAVLLPIPDVSGAVRDEDRAYLELLDFRNVTRDDTRPDPLQPGASSLRFHVRGFDALLARMRAAGVNVLTRGGSPVLLEGSDGLAGQRAIVVSDPDGYPVELVDAGASAPAIGAAMTLVVSDLDATLAVYRLLVGDDARMVSRTPWQSGSARAALFGTPAQRHRGAVLQLPGCTCTLEFIQYRGTASAWWPRFVDIGPAHVAFIARDMDRVLAQMRGAGVRTLARSGTYTQFNPTLKAVYTRDPDGHFIEIIERD